MSVLLTLKNGVGIDLIGSTINLSGSVTVNGSIAFPAAAQIDSASYAENALTASYVNTLNQNVLITGSLTVGATSLGANENTLVLGPSPAGGTGEGGQILLQAPGGTYTSASMWDNYQNQTRLLRGTNAGSDAVVASFNMHTKQMQLPSYNALNAFSGTPVAALGVNSNGDIITIQTGSGAGSGGGSTFQGGTNVDNRIITATGATPELNGEANLTFNGTSLTVTGQITSSGAITSQANNQMYFRGGDDAEFWDINVANTVGIYGQQNADRAGVKLGSSGPTLFGSSSRLGIGTTTPTQATVEVNGNVWASSYTGSLFGSSSWARSSVTSSTILVYRTGSNANWYIPFVDSIGSNDGTIERLFTTDGTSLYFNPSNGSLTTTSFTGSLQGTSSWASRAITASFLPIGTYNITSSWAQSSSQALTASYTPNALVTASVSSNVITFTRGNGTTFNLTIATGSGGGGSTSPGGSDKQIQFNSGSRFSGSANLIYNYNTTGTSAYRLEHYSDSNFKTTHATIDDGAILIYNKSGADRKMHTNILQHQFRLTPGTGLNSIFLFDANGSNSPRGDLRVYGFKCDYSLMSRSTGTGENLASKVGTLWGAWTHDDTIAPTLNETIADGDTLYNELAGSAFTLGWVLGDVELSLDPGNGGTADEVYFSGLFTIFGSSN